MNANSSTSLMTSTEDSLPISNSSRSRTAEKLFAQGEEILRFWVDLGRRRLLRAAVGSSIGWIYYWVGSDYLGTLFFMLLGAAVASFYDYRFKRLLEEGKRVVGLAFDIETRVDEITGRQETYLIYEFATLEDPDWKIWAEQKIEDSYRAAMMIGKPLPVYYSPEDPSKSYAHVKAVIDSVLPDGLRSDRTAAGSWE